MLTAYIVLYTVFRIRCMDTYYISGVGGKSETFNYNLYVINLCSYTMGWDDIYS